MIDYDAFLDWTERHFDSVKTSGNEVQLNSIYDPDGDDRKHKLWCSPSGGKHGRENGVYHCWISGKKGTLVGLVMDVEGCSYQRACETLGVEGDLDHIEEELEAFFAARKTVAVEAPEPKKTLSLPPGTRLIGSLPRDDRLRMHAQIYLDSRRIAGDGLFVCGQGDYRDRIIIPYHDREGTLIYFNGRYMGSNRNVPKYLGPPKEAGVGKGDVVYMPKWAPCGSTLMVTEGEFDAMVLSICGFHACSVGGSHLTAVQRRILRDYRICLCGDVDKPGAGAVFRAGMQLLEEGFKDIRFVRPPRGCKDWNDLYLKHSEALVAHYIWERLKPFNLITAESLFGY